jgi:amidohydrolase
MGCTAQVEFKAHTPPVTNDAGVTKTLQELVRLNSPESQLDTTYQTMISEDMAFILQEIPGCYFLVGGANPDKGLIYSHHHPKFDFDEEALIRGSALMAASVMRLLKE